MMKKIFFLLLIPAALLSARPCGAQADLYSFPDIGQAKAAAPNDPPADPFMKSLALRFGLDEAVLARAFSKGVGRREMIELILISRGSKDPLPGLIDERRKGAKLAGLAKSRGLDPRKIRSEARRLAEEVGKALSGNGPGPRTAGTFEPLQGGGTGYAATASSGPERGGK